MPCTTFGHHRRRCSCCIGSIKSETDDAAAAEAAAAEAEAKHQAAIAAQLEAEQAAAEAEAAKEAAAIENEEVKCILSIGVQNRGQGHAYANKSSIHGLEMHAYMDKKSTCSL